MDDFLVSETYRIRQGRKAVFVASIELARMTEAIRREQIVLLGDGAENEGKVAFITFDVRAQLFNVGVLFGDACILFGEQGKGSRRKRTRGSRGIDCRRHETLITIAIHMFVEKYKTRM